jgi:hypothetical protein
MPSRWACVVILLLWAVATVGLVTRDVLPDMLIGPPPDLRSVAAADRSAGPTKWSILVADDVNFQSLRSVGQAITNSTLDPQGNLKLEGRVWFNSGGLLQGTPLAKGEDLRIEVDNECHIDPSGNLLSFGSLVRIEGSEEPFVTVDGVYNNHAIDLRSRSALPLLSFTKSIPYEPKTMIKNMLGPIDRLPGLAVGQRWEERIISPLTGKIDIVRAEVTRKSELYWDKGMVATLEVMHKLPPAFSARTWVRKSDGLVLRQEVPLPMVKLLIERQP